MLVSLCACRYGPGDASMRTLVDVQLIAAMGPPGGGRNSISPRLLRHFTVVAINEFDDATCTRIFGAISDWCVRPAHSAVNNRIAHPAAF